MSRCRWRPYTYGQFKGSNGQITYGSEGVDGLPPAFTAFNDGGIAETLSSPPMRRSPVNSS